MQSWRNLKIFISSTFKDMDAERDAIKFNVIPRLNDFYRERCIQFQVVDLRVGVNTADIPEELRENKVLDVCLENIDDSRPFFIGLLGERYGWIPPEERFEYILSRLGENRRPLISSGAGKSVTELEILYGAIGNNGENVAHSIFFFRDPASYEGLPEHMLSLYRESSAGLVDGCSVKLDALKKSLVDILGKFHKEPCIYKLQWDKQQNKFSDIDAFAELVFNRLRQDVDAESNGAMSPVSWWEQEKSNDEYLSYSYASCHVKREIVGNLEQRLVAGEQLVVSGGRGTGKSSILSGVYRDLMASGTALCLLAYIGSTGNASSLRLILGKWINELDVAMEKEPEFDSLERAENCDIRKLEDLFRMRGEEFVAQTGKKVVVLIDEIDKLSIFDLSSSFLVWLPASFSLLATTGTENAGALQVNPHMSKLELPSYSVSEYEKIVSMLECRYSYELGIAVKRKLERFRMSPLHLNLVVSMLANLSAVDFNVMRNIEAASEIDRITLYVSMLVDNAPAGIAQLFKYSFLMSCRNVGADVSMWKAIEMVALSKSGLRETDIEALLGKGWDSLAFRTLMGIYNQHFYEDRILHKWQFRSKGLSEEIEAEVENSQSYYTELAELLLSYPDYDPLRREMAVYYIIRSGSLQLVRLNMLFPLFDDSLNANIQEQFKISIRYLIANPQMAMAALKQAASRLKDAERIVFYYHVLYRGIPDIMERKMLQPVMDEFFDMESPEEMEISVAYALASMLSESLLFEQYNFDGKQEDRLDKSEKVIAAYKYCYRLDSGYRDCRNMLKAVIANHIPILADAGEYAKLEDMIVFLSTIK